MMSCYFAQFGKPCMCKQEGLSRRKSYYEFLKSPAWRKISKECKALAGYLCKNCQKGGILTAHHKSYPNCWYQTKQDQLECLCQECHNELHGAKKKAKAQSKRVKTLNGPQVSRSPRKEKRLAMNALFARNLQLMKPLEGRVRSKAHKRHIKKKRPLKRCWECREVLNFKPPILIA